MADDYPPQFPEVVITTADSSGSGPVPVRKSRISIGGVDITNAVREFRVGGVVDDCIEIDLKLLCGNVRWERPEASDGA